MKLCPQCDFIYEDDQSFCDMDGKELVCDPAPVIVEKNDANPLSPTPKRSAGRRSMSFAVAVVVGVVLTALVVVVYFARVHQTRSRAASGSSTHSPDRLLVQSAGQPPAQSNSEATAAQPSASDLVSTETPSAETALPEQSVVESSSQSDASAGSASTSQPFTSRASLAHSRLAANPVSAGAPSGNSRGPVIVRLNNGAAIKADEAWEKKEGIWYRQAGMVTFIKRSRVRTIERLAPPAAPQKSAANNVQDKSRKTQNNAAQNPLRLARLEPVDTKPQSRVVSFLKKTGRILKKPFKF